LINAATPDDQSVFDRLQHPKALVCDQVVKTFSLAVGKKVALDGVSCTIHPHRVTGLIGPDGAGKTTLMRICAGLLTPDRGQVTVMDLNVIRGPLAVQEVIGYMPQRFGLYEDLSVRENIELYADLQGVSEGLRRERYAHLLRMSGLEGVERRLAGRLSGGMKQKLGLVCTLVRRPRLLLLDEPTVGVDPVSRRELWAIVYQLVEEEGMSVVLSTAYLDEAERCAEVIVLHQGRILGQDHPRTFSRQVAGRIWSVQAPSVPKRRLQHALSCSPAVLDALIHGSSVRVITRLGETVPTDVLPGKAIAVKAVEPRFEDYFVATLKDWSDERDNSSVITLERQIPRFSGQDVISAENLIRRFGAFLAVDRVSFKVQGGEIYGLLGANGAGKTTTFRMLCGLLPISGGQGTVAGMNLRTATAAARGRIGYMAQRFSLYGNLTILQNLAFFSSVYGLRGRRRAARINWALETFHLKPFTGVESQSLPPGFKQRLALAVALMHEPEVLFLDEPTSGVDPLARREFWAQINSLAEQGVTVLVTTHFMEEAEYCDRLAIMAEGRVLAEGTPEDMKARHGGPAGRAATMEDAFVHLLESARHNEAVAE
jgi:ABC-2 type transport system ATP-binding protein